ncbi:MAG: 50S ribosomal protein L20 [Candidatus Shikimatogenerans sp. JK-2022]|nr:50S ribosomal protein L20 [Candidatus Shikimatogenerans bostrichidophilus]
MPRSKNIVSSKKRRKKILKLAKSYYGVKKKCYTIAKNSVEKALLNSYIGRKNKKRFFRKLWIIRINAFVRKNFNINYSKFIFLLKKKKINLNRKIISYYLSNKNNLFIKNIL